MAELTEKRRKELDAERLGYHRQIRDFHKKHLDQKGHLGADGSIKGFHSQIEMHVDAVDRLDAALADSERLRAENERLTAALEVFLNEGQYYCIEDGHGCFHGWPWQEHKEDCPIHIAGKALHPEFGA